MDLRLATLKQYLSICCKMFQHWINAERFPVSHLCVNTLPASSQSLYTQMWHRKPLCIDSVLKHCAANRKRLFQRCQTWVHIYTTLAFLALLGAPYIYDISSLRVNLPGTPLGHFGLSRENFIFLTFTALAYRSFDTTVSQLKICDFSGEAFRDFEVL